MNARNIQIADRLTLKPNNPYGYGPLIVTVMEIRRKHGYKTPWIICEPQHDDGTHEWAFRPSDFKGHA